MNSLWSCTSEMPNFESLKENIETDVLIIGGGIAGILCAYELDRQNVDYVLVEANKICSGITKNTTAKITSQHGLIYDSIARKYNFEAARLYLESNELAIKKYQNICQNTDCDFQIEDNYVYCVDNENKIEKELNVLKKIGFEAQKVNSIPLPVTIKSAIKFKNQARFHPLKFIAQISKNLKIYENTKILELKGTTAITKNGKITAKKIISATHFPFINKHGSYYLKLYQHRSYVIALKDASEINGMYVDESKKGMSFRNANGLLLIGGGDHRTGKNGGNWAELERFAYKYYPFSKIEYKWATQDCMSLDGIPYIGQYSSDTPDFFVASGFNKWGMTSAMVSALILSDLVQGKKNSYSTVYSPSRSIIHPQLGINAFEAVVNLLTPTKKRCPHLGCALKWNPDEHSWDCPCHGSRFTEDGKLIDNPATGNLRQK